MADKSIKITIATALNAAGFTATKRAISSLVSGTKDFAAKVGGNLMNIKAGFDILAASAQKFLSVMSKGMEFERLTATFKTLTGSMELAAAHMRDLQDLGRTPPFSLEEFASASRMMMKMTDGMLGYKASLEMVGDMAAATGNDISQVGRAVGLAYQIIRDGQSFGRAGQMLYTMGLMTKAQVAEFDELSKSGATNAEVWEKLTGVLGRYKGAMAETEKTTKGVVEAIQGEATVAVTEFSAAITKAAKPALDGILERVKRLNEDGTIERWATRAASAFSKFSDAAKSVISWGGKVADAYGWAKDMLERGGATIGAFIGTAYEQGLGTGGSNKDAWNIVADHYESAVKEQKERAKEAAKEDARIREQADAMLAEKKRARAEEAEKAEAEAQKRIVEDMANAKAEAERKAMEKAQEDAHKAAIEQEKAYREWQAKQAKESARKELEASRNALNELHKDRMEKIDAEQRRVADEIDALKAKGADNPMARAAGMDQGAEEGARRQRAKDGARMIDAETNLIKKMIDKGATVDDPTKLGRLSNLEKAALERMQLAKKEAEARRLQKERDERERQMAKDIDDINKKLANVGL